MTNRPPIRPNASSRSKRPSLALLLPALVLTLAACAGSAAVPSPSPSIGPVATVRPTPTPVLGDPGNGGAGGGTDPGTGTGGGNNGGGIVVPPGDPNTDPLFGQANYVTPAKDLLNPHPVNVQLVRAIQNEDGTIAAELRWWSGVAPCNQLDHVQYEQDDAARTIKLTVVEGSGKGDIACIDIAQLNATTIDLGTLAAGEWKLSAEGDAPTINLTVQ